MGSGGQDTIDTRFKKKMPLAAFTILCQSKKTKAFLHGGKIL